MKKFNRTQPKSGSIVSPPGSGKKQCFCNTLQSDLKTIIVVDPAIELYSMTHVAREFLGNDVYVVCPHPDDATRSSLGILDDAHRAGLFGRKGGQTE